MSMSNFPSGFEEHVQKAMDMPEPDTEKMNALRARFIAQGVATLKAERQDSAVARMFPTAQANPTNLKPSSFRRPAWQWALLGLALLVVAALASPGVVKALRPLLGYIPGVGVLEQSPSALVLADPVVIQRDGFTLTVDQAVSTAEKTVIVYRYTEPARDGSNAQPQTDDQFTPVIFPVLQLPDGSSLEVLEIQPQPYDGTTVITALWFAPLPADTDAVTLEFTRLNGMPPGMGPENWEIPIRFKPGDLSSISLPVVEYDAAPTHPAETDQAAQLVQSPGQQAPLTQTVLNDGITLSLEKAVELPDGYLLMGSLQWTDASISPYAMMLGVPPVVKDANGQTVAFEWAPPDSDAQPDELRHYWAYKITTQDFAPPLSLAFNVLLWEPADATFQFDPGPNPQDGQTWDLTMDIPVNNHTVKVISAKYLNPEPGSRAFDLTMTSDSDVIGAVVADQNQSAVAGGGEGNSMPQEIGVFYSAFGLESGLPVGPITVVFRSLEVLVPGDWTISWAP